MSSFGVGRLFLAGDIVVVVGVEGGLPSVFVVVLCSGLPWAVELGPSLLFRLSVWGVDGGCTRFVESSLVIFVCASVWGPSFITMAVGDIAVGTVGGGGLLMVYLIARRSVFSPFGSLGFGFMEIRGGMGGLLGGVPITDPLGDFR